MGGIRRRVGRKRIKEVGRIRKRVGRRMNKRGGEDKEESRGSPEYTRSVG